jgi:hypothetical protein
LSADQGTYSSYNDYSAITGGNQAFSELIPFEQSEPLPPFPLDTRINADEAHAAAELARFFLAHGRAVYAAQAEPPEIRDAKYLWERIKSLKSLSIGKRELLRKAQGKQGFDINESLTLLVERGYIRLEFTPTGGVGRPSETIIVNPETQAIVTKLTLLTKSPQQDNKVNKVIKVTIPVNIPNVYAAAQFTEMPAGEIDDDCPFK